MIVRLSLLLLSTILIGCDRTNSPPSAAEAHLASAAVATSMSEKVNRIEYVNWNRFPVNTRVTRVRTTRNTGGTVVVTTHEKLIEKTTARVLVEMQINVKRSNEALVKNDPMTHEFPATFALPVGMQAEQFSLPSLKAKRVGTETISILGKDFEADIYEWHDSSEAGRVHCLLWSSLAFPGRVLKQTQESDEAGFSSEEVVTEFDIPVQ